MQTDQRPRKLWTVLGVARRISVPTLAGLVAGLAGGFAARLAMRVAGATTGPACAHLVTENGNDCGVITAPGTIFLVMFGAFFGVAGGAVYGATKAWFGPRRRGLLYGLFLFAVAGFAIVDANNEDFDRFGIPILNVVVFGGVYIVFGIVLVALDARLDRRLPVFPPPEGDPISLARGIGYAVVLFPVALATVIGVGILGSSLDPAPILAVVMLGLPLLAQARRSRALTVLAVLPFAAGALLTTRSVVQIIF